MKTQLSLFFTAVLLSLCTTLGAQEIFSTKDPASKQKLDALENDTAFYPSFGNKGEKVAFSQEKDLEMFMGKWQNYLQAMGNWFSDKDFAMNEGIFFRIFFDKQGSAKYIFYVPKNKNSSILKGKRKAQFEQLLKEFAAQERLDVNAPYCFKQCGSAKFQDSQSTKQKEKKK
jgi:hypothetical protein